MNPEPKSIEELMLKVRIDVGFDALLDTIFKGIEKPTNHRQMEPLLLSKVVFNELIIDISKAIKWISPDGKNFITVKEMAEKIEAKIALEKMMQKVFEQAPETLRPKSSGGKRAKRIQN